MFQALGEVSIKQVYERWRPWEENRRALAHGVLKETLGDKCPPPLPAIPSYEEWCTGGRKDEERIKSGCATLKLAKRPAGFPIILESATQLTTAEGDDGISTAHRPEHSRSLQPSQHSFTACLNDSRAHE
jgi:hypothetical protein